jgi:VWFA-related protein
MFTGSGRAALLLSLVLALAAPLSAQTGEQILYASVVAKDGTPVLDLTRADFIVREDGVSREILKVDLDTDPLQIALLIDNSDIMRNHLNELRRALTGFVDSVREAVQIALVTLAERPTIVVGYTTDRASLHKTIDRIFAYNAGNYLLDGIAETSQGLAKRTVSRSAIVVITGLGPEMSYRQYTEVLRYFREGGAALHVLSLGMGIGTQGREIVLARGTSETGGRYEHVLSIQGMENKARQVGTEVSNQYRVVFARPDRLVPPKRTEVSVKRPDLQARGMLVKSDRQR